MEASSHQSWHPPFGANTRDQRDFLVARVTLSRDASGTFIYTGSANSQIGVGGEAEFRLPFFAGFIGCMDCNEEPPLLFGDYNGDGQVEQGDLDLFLLNWGPDAANTPEDWSNDFPT